MLVKEVMTKSVITVDKNCTVLDACNLYKKHKIGCLLVTDSGKNIGILTERDIIERTICELKDPEITKVIDVMSSDLKTIHPLDNIDKAVDMMKKFGIKKLPVLKNDKIVGIITVSDVYKVRPDVSKRFMDSWVTPEWR